MSQSPTTSPKQKWYAPSRLSQAATVTIVFCCALLLVTCLAWLAYQADPTRVALSDYLTLPRATTLLVLFTFTGGLVYWAATVWFEESASRSDDLEQAWLAGMQALRTLGIRLNELPVFVYLGCADPAAQRRLVDSAGQRLLMPVAPSGTSPISWYISENAIRIFCSNVGVLGRTVVRLQELAQGEKTNTTTIVSSYLTHNCNSSPAACTVKCTDGSHPQDTAQATNQPPAQNASVQKNQGDSEVDLHSPMPGSASDSAALPPSGDRDSRASDNNRANATGIAARPHIAINGNKSDSSAAERIAVGLESVEGMVENELRRDRVRQAQRNLVSEESCLSTSPVDTITSIEAVACQQAIEDFGTKLRSARRPVAGINGIAVVVDAQVATGSLASAVTCGRAIQQDLAQLENIVGVRSPVTLLLNSAEHLTGMCELIRRLGPDRAAQQTLGVVADPSVICDANYGGQVASLAVRRVSQEVYDLLSGPNVLTIPGNDKLVRLLITCRGDMVRNLQTLVLEALGGSVLPASTPSTTMFSGIFFVATGENLARRGFVKELFHRMHAQQQMLQWTWSELRCQAKQAILWRALVLATILLGLTLVAQLLEIGGR